MRWIWIDRFLEFESGKFARAIKNISINEDHLQTLPGQPPTFPNTLIIEGLAQTGGILVGELENFQKNIILAKVERANFIRDVGPGDSLILEAQILYAREEGYKVECRASVDNEEVGSATLVFASQSGENFVFTDEFMGLFKRKMGSALFWEKMGSILFFTGAVMIGKIELTPFSPLTPFFSRAE